VSAPKLAPDRRDRDRRAGGMSAALDFARSALEEAKLGKLKPRDAETVIRIIDRAQGREAASERVIVRAERAKAIAEIRSVVLAAWRQQTKKISIEAVIDRLIYVVRMEIR
jgi:hypothetical protein